MSQNRHVLVVDDDPLIGMLLEALLEAEGWEVSTAATVAEARALLAAGPAPRVLVLDEQLPDGNGIELTASVGAQTHVVLHSGAEPVEVPAGVDAVVSKLGSPGALAEHLARI